MAAPEAPVCYVGVSRRSAAFRLMKQMVLPRLLLLFRTSNWKKAVILIHSLCFVVLCRGGKKAKGLGKTSKGSKDMSESKTNKTRLVCYFVFFNFSFDLVL